MYSQYNCTMDDTDKSIMLGPQYSPISDVSSNSSSDGDLIDYSIPLTTPTYFDTKSLEEMVVLRSTYAVWATGESYQHLCKNLHESTLLCLITRLADRQADLLRSQRAAVDTATYEGRAEVASQLNAHLAASIQDLEALQPYLQTFAHGLKHDAPQPFCMARLIEKAEQGH